MAEEAVGPRRAWHDSFGASSMRNACNKQGCARLRLGHRGSTASDARRVGYGLRRSTLDLIGPGAPGLLAAGMSPYGAYPVLP